MRTKLMHTFDQKGIHGISKWSSMEEPVKIDVTLEELTRAVLEPIRIEENPSA